MQVRVLGASRLAIKLHFIASSQADDRLTYCFTTQFRGAGSCFQLRCAGALQNSIAVLVFVDFPRGRARIARSKTRDLSNVMENRANHATAGTS